MTAGSVPAEQLRLGRSVWMHAGAAVVFGLLAWSGVTMLGPHSSGMGVPLLIAGAAGCIGSLVVAASVRRQRATLRGGTRVQAAARLVMAAAAVAAAVAGVALAPGGMDHDFVIGVAVFHAILLAAYASFCGDRPRITS